MRILIESAAAHTGVAIFSSYNIHGRVEPAAAVPLGVVGEHIELLRHVRRHHLRTSHGYASQRQGRSGLEEQVESRLQYLARDVRRLAQLHLVGAPLERRRAHRQTEDVPAV